MEIKTEIIKATCKGLKYSSLPNQDYILIAENNNYLLAAVSDGLGSSKNSLIGAEVVCRIIHELIKITNSNIQSTDLSSTIIKQWKDIINNKPGVVEDYKTTNSFVAILKSERKIVVGRLGDVMVVMRIDGVYVPIINFNKEFLNETECLGSGSTQDYKIDCYDFRNSFEFLVVTDGIGDDLILDKLHLLFTYLKTKYSAIKKSKRNFVLKKEIEQALYNKNDDDKSLVFAWSYCNSQI